MKKPLVFNEGLLRTGGLTLQRSTPPLIHLTLTRPSALNALLPSTFHALHHVIDLLQSTPNTRYYLLLSAQGRAFSAGGDVRSLRFTLLGADNAGPNTPARLAAAKLVLSTEYDLLARWHALAGSPIITIALGNGIAFGAGAGLFQACSLRLVTPNFAMAMPEARIGLIPDCGATRFYARLPGCVGMFLALTGARVQAADALQLGLADGAVHPEWDASQIADGDDVCEKRVRDCFAPAEDALGEPTDLCDPAGGKRRGIDEVFSATSVGDVVQRLRERASDDWAVDALAAMQGASPTAMGETFAVMRMAYAAQDEGIREALDRELAVESRLAAAEDFEEGVRAALIDKDGKPKWMPVQQSVEKD